MEAKSPIFKMSVEAKVGLFVLGGIILLVYMSLRVGGIQLGRAEGYMLRVNFASAAGLDKDASVRVAGVEVGKVTSIALKDNHAAINLMINKDIRIGRDFTAVLTTKGLLGERYIELIPGAPNAPLLKDGDEITRTTSYADMDKLMTVLTDVSADVKNVTATLSKVLGGPEGEASLRSIVRNVEEVSYKMNRLVDNNDERINDIIRNLDSLSGSLLVEGVGTVKDLRQTIQGANDALAKTLENLNGVIAENRGNVKESIENLRVASIRLQEAMESVNALTRKVTPEISDTMGSLSSITRKIDKGEGTLGRLVNDPAIHDNLSKTISGINRYIDKAESIHTFIGYRGEYIFDARDTKSYLSLKIQPKADKYYLVEIIDDPRGKRSKTTTETATGGTTTTTTETFTKDDLKVSAQIAKAFGKLTLRAGIIESTGGAAVDYHLYHDKLKITLEAFDFNQKGNPHLKAGATFYVNKYFYFTAGYDDFASKTGFSTAFLGAGFQFDDEDLKYLLSSAPPVSSLK